MATIAEMLIANAQQSAGQPAPDLGSSISRGAQLAQSLETMQQQRAQIQKQKEDLELQKANSVMDTIKIASESKDPKLKNYLFKNVIPAKVKALKMDGLFSPASLEMMEQSEEVRKKVLGLQLDLDQKIRTGELTGAQAYQIAQQTLNDPEELAMLPTDALFEAQKFASSEEGKAYRAKLVGQIGVQKEAAKTESVGQQELAKKVAANYAEYTTAGGKAGIDAALTSLTEAANALKSGEVVTGGISTKLPGFKSDDAQTMLNPKLVEVKSQAQGALNSVLRATLGAQFTEREGERVLNQIWDDRQPPRVNAKKIDNKIKELRSSVRNSEAEFQRFGYLRPETAAKGQDSKISEYAKQFSLSYEQAQKILEQRGYKPGGK